MSRPVFTIIAGSNGCGKTTLTSSTRANLQSAPLFDPDAIARSLQETHGAETSDIEAGKRVLQSAERLIASLESFTIETTLSGKTYLKMAERAKNAGFSIVVVFVGTSSVEINLQRVKARVRQGGHDVPEEDQRRRFPRTRVNIAKLLPLADMAVIFDNSSDRGHTLVAAGHRGFMNWVEPVPEWAAFLRS